ncbi:hypothetical protein LINPERPRIM_LOCUS13499 [Linum perenne]
MSKFQSCHCKAHPCLPSLILQSFSL